MVKFAACQYALERFASWNEFATHFAALVDEAAAYGAEIVLMPEYSAMALTGLLSDDLCADLHGSIAAIQPLLPEFLKLSEELAKKHGIWFCPGSAPVLDPDDKFRNRAFLFGPDGPVGVQDKIVMTRFEREQWNIAAGVDGLNTFETPFGKLGILICYDNEFPLLARRLAEEGVDLVLSPSCTDTEAGYYRVRIGAQARALENQFAVLVSPTAGHAPWSPAVDTNCGKAALYVPSDYGVPPSGVWCESEAVFTATSRWLYGEIDLADVARLRHEGQVALFRHWPDQVLP